MPNTKNRIGQSASRALTSKDKNDHREIAAINFEPTDHREILKMLDRDTFLSLGPAVRKAMGLLCLSKPQMVEMAEKVGDDEWFTMIDEFQGAGEIFASFSRALLQAKGRCFVVAGVMSVNEQAVV